MSVIIFRTFYLFFVVVEFILMFYILMSWLPMSAKVRELMNHIVAPILDPIRYLLRHSIFYSQVADLSPLVAFVLLAYLQKLFYI